MKKTNLRKSKGITLIALVITIIVLLILAGVAISMLSGENGILKKAAEAKTKTEEGQKQEETALASMELETYFQTENKKYKCSNGFITGIKVETKVSELQSALPEGYTVKAIDETDKFTATDTGKEDGNPIVTTGLAIQKDNKTVARTLIFGDLDGNGKIAIGDTSCMIECLVDEKCSEIQIVAADVNNDGIINNKDTKLISEEMNKSNIIVQNRYANKASDLKVEYNSEIKRKYAKDIEEVFKGTNYTIENKENEYYIKGLNSSMKISELKELLKDINTEKNIYRTDEILEIDEKQTNMEETIKNGDKLYFTYSDGREIPVAIIVI